MIYKDSIKAILMEMWPTLLLVSVVCFSMRTIYLIKNKEKLVLYKELFYYFFIVYILCLFYVVTFGDVTWSTSNFKPFKEIFRYDFGSRLFFKNVLGNMILFMPFGFFTAYFLKLKKWYSITILSLLTSFTIEITQLLIGRVFDVDDIILNLLGGFLGYMVYRLISKMPKSLKKDSIYNIIVILLLLIGFILFRLVIL